MRSAQLYITSTRLRSMKANTQNTGGNKHHKWRFTVEPSQLRDSPGSSIPYYPSRSEEHAQLGSGYWLLTTPLFYKGYREAPRFNINLWCLLPPDAGVEGDWPSLWDPLERGDRFMILANTQKGFTHDYLLFISFVLNQIKVCYNLIRRSCKSIDLD